MGRMISPTPPMPSRYVSDVSASVKASGRPSAPVTRNPMTRTASGAAPATSGMSTEAITTPAVPSDHVSDARSRHGRMPSCHN